MTPADLALPAPVEGTAEAAARVAFAREAQLMRARDAGAEGSRLNAQLDAPMTEKLAAPDEAGAALLARASEQLTLSARAYHRTLRVARTIADLDGAGGVKRAHIAEALSLKRVWAGQSEMQTGGLRTNA
ncbi:MAG: ATP-binding protein [Caulobacterales bacterium]